MDYVNAAMMIVGYVFTTLCVVSGFIFLAIWGIEMHAKHFRLLTSYRQFLKEQRDKQWDDEPANISRRDNKNDLHRLDD